MKNYEEILQNGQLNIIDKFKDEDSVCIHAYFFDPINQKRYFVKFTSSYGWEHASVSQSNKTPTWDIMCRIKDVFWGGDEVCIEYHPNKEDYINNHEHCLHIWKPIGVEIPTPPSIMVGIKGISQDEVKAFSQAYFGSLNEKELMELADRKGIKINRELRRLK